MVDLDELLDEEPAEEEDSEEPSEQETLERAAAAAAQREDADTQALIRRIRSLEAQGAEDPRIVADLERRGISRQAAMRAWQQHVEDFPEHGHEEQPPAFTDENLEERLGGVRAPEQTGNPLYDLQGRVDEASNQELYNALEQAETYITGRGGVTDQEYEALNMVEQELERRRGGDPGYESEVVQSIKRVGRLQIGDTYLGSDNQGL